MCEQDPVFARVLSCSYRAYTSTLVSFVQTLYQAHVDVNCSPSPPTGTCEHPYKLNPKSTLSWVRMLARTLTGP